MSLKSIVHPETISKRNLLYRGWHHLIRNRLWHGRVPERQSICLWFWPALFGTLLFTPIIYPLLLAIVYPIKYLFLVLGFCVYYPLKLAWIVLRFALGWPIGRFVWICRVSLHRRLTVGHLIMLAAGVGLAWIPTVNYWVVGVATVLIVSYIIYWMALSLIAAFFRSLWHIVGTLPGLWLTAEKYPNRQTQFWWLTVAVYLLLASPVVLWRNEGVSSLYTKIILAIGILLIFAGVIAYSRYWERKHPSPQPEPKRRARPEREPWTKPVSIFIRAKKSELCPIVEFVD